MSDQGLWFKLWVSVLTDDAIQNMSLEDVGRWCLLGAYLKQHGNNGMICLSAPATTLKNQFRLATFEELVDALKRLPNCVTHVSKKCDDSIPSQLTVEWKNWHKYQVDSSARRMQKLRRDVTLQKRREEKRKEEKRMFVPPTPQQAQEYAKSIGFDLDGEKFVAHYQKTGWRLKSGPITDWKACVVTWKKYSAAPPVETTRVQ